MATSSPFNLPPVAFCCSAYGNSHESHDVQPPCATVQRDLTIAHALRDAWQEGRESIATDMLRPLPANGIREATPNPYA